MRFDVLGSLRCFSDEAELPLRGRKSRLLLAVLLSRANQVVPVEALANAIWDGRPPDTARRAIRWHVHQLRHLLDDQDRVEHVKTGYRLNAGTEEIDAEEFEELYRQSSVAKSKKQTSQVSQLLDRALNLWRGPAYGDLADCQLLHESAARLDQLRLEATEQRCSAEMELGNYSSVIDELSELVQRFPLREQLRAQLMLALHYSGRQAEALQVYVSGQQQLIDELGLDPGPALRDAEKIVRSGKTPVAAASSSQDQPRPSVNGHIPGELPAQAVAFTGREELVAALEKELTANNESSPKVATINGPGGIGKSALAIHLAHKVKQHFDDGQLYLDLRGAIPNTEPLSPGSALLQLLRSLGVDDLDASLDVDELSNRFRTLTAHKKLVILLDNASDVFQVRPLLPGGAGCAVVITSRKELATLDGASAANLQSLPEYKAIDLLEHLIGQERVRHEPDAAARLVQRCGGIPLALTICAARLNTRPSWPVSVLVSMLANENHRLSELSVEDVAIRSSLNVSYRDLANTAHGEASRKLFRLLGLYRGTDFTAGHAAALAGVVESEAVRILELLTDAQLVEAHIIGRYRLHDLVRLYARELVNSVESETVADAAFRRVVDWYCATTRRCVELLSPARTISNRKLRALTHPGSELAGRDEARDWAVAEVQNLLALCGSLPESKEVAATAVETCVNMVGSVAEYVDQVTVQNVCEAAVGIADAAQLPKSQAATYLMLGFSLKNGGLLDEAQTRLTAALEVAKQLEDEMYSSGVLGTLGVVARMRGDYQQAKIYALESLRLSRTHSLKLNEINAIVQLGFIHESVGEADEAIAAFKQGADIAYEFGNHISYAGAMGNIGYVQLETGNYTAALDSFNGALAIDEELGLVGTVVNADHLWGLADTYHRMNDSDKAAQYRMRAASLLRKLRVLSAEEMAAIEAGEVLERPQKLK